MNIFKSRTKKSERDCWETPQWLVGQIERILKVRFILDPCANNDNCKAWKYFDEEDNGLEVSWRSYIFDQCFDNLILNPAIFVNPPFSKLDQWIDKIIQESRNGLFIVLLHPDSSDTKWYQKIEDHCFMQLIPNSRINFIKPGETKESSGVSFHSVISVFNTLPKTNVQRIRFDLDKKIGTW